jgi:hypothetical protein
LAGSLAGAGTSALILRAVSNASMNSCSSIKPLWLTSKAIQIILNSAGLMSPNGKNAYSAGLSFNVKMVPVPFTSAFLKAASGLKPYF